MDYTDKGDGTETIDSLAEVRELIEQGTEIDGVKTNYEITESFVEL